MQYTYNYGLNEDNSLGAFYASHNNICKNIHNQLENDSLKRIDFRPTELSYTNTMKDEPLLNAWEQYMLELEQQQLEKRLKEVPRLNTLDLNSSKSQSLMEEERMEEEPVFHHLEIIPVQFEEDSQMSATLLSDEGEIMIEVTNDSDSSISTTDPGSPPVYQVNLQGKSKQRKLKPTKGSGKKMVKPMLNRQEAVNEVKKEQEMQMVWIWNENSGTMGNGFQQIPYMKSAQALK